MAYVVLCTGLSLDNPKICSEWGGDIYDGDILKITWTVSNNPLYHDISNIEEYFDEHSTGRIAVWDNGSVICKYVGFIKSVTSYKKGDEITLIIRQGTNTEHNDKYRKLMELE